MSGPKGRRVVHQPTAQQIREGNLAVLRGLCAEAAEVRREAARLARSWSERAPHASAALAAFHLPDVVAAAAGTAAEEVEAARVALDRARARLRFDVARCVAEESARKAREAAELAELRSARSSAPVASIGFLDEAAPESGGPREVPAEASAPAAPVIPAVEDRTDKVSVILGRAPAGVPLDVAEACITRAAMATTLVEWDAALQGARSAVDTAVAAEDRRLERLRTERAAAARLHGSLVGLDGDDVHRWRLHLEAVLDDRQPLDPRADAAVAAARSQAIRRRLVTVLEAAGCTHLAEQDGVLVGYVDHGGGGATRVRCDDEGLLLTPVASSARDAGEVRRLEELNCELDRRLRKSAAEAGLDLMQERSAGFGEVPLRIEDLPFGAETSPAAPAEAERDRRRRRTRGSSTRRQS